MNLPEGGWPKTATAMYLAYARFGYLFWLLKSILATEPGNPGRRP